MRLLSWLGGLLRPRPRFRGDGERRVWVRFPLRTPVAEVSVQSPAGARWCVQIRDISRGGARLSVPHSLEPGAFVSVEIPGEPPATVLACVVRATALPNGGWELGCAFSTEISDEDIQKLVGDSVKTEPTDRRSWERAVSNKEIAFQVVGADAPKWETASLVDVSAGGAALRVQQPVDLQAMVRLELRGGDWKSEAVLLGTVIRTTQLAECDWVLGCSFVRELDEAELEIILDEARGA